MSDDHIRYDILVQEALRGVVRKVVGEVQRTGLPGDHHFYIAFDTNAPGVRISSRLREQYPEEMTVVLQHQFWDLSVTEHTFEVGLSFGGVPERLLVPFSAIKGFFDPSVQFGLQFEADTEGKAANDAEEQTVDDTFKNDMSARPLANAGHDDPAPEEPDTVDAEAEAQPDGENDPAEGGADVVSLDSFRKKT